MADHVPLADPQWLDLLTSPSMRPAWGSSPVCCSRGGVPSCGSAITAGRMFAVHAWLLLALLRDGEQRCTGVCTGYARLHDAFPGCAHLGLSSMAGTSAEGTILGQTLQGTFLATWGPSKCSFHFHKPTPSRVRQLLLGKLGEGVFSGCDPLGTVPRSLRDTRRLAADSPSAVRVPGYLFLRPTKKKKKTFQVLISGPSAGDDQRVWGDPAGGSGPDRQPFEGAGHCVR